MALRYLILLFALLSISYCEQSRADSFGINLYGLSYHAGQEAANRDDFNEVNEGIGLRADFGSKKGDSFFLEGGMYEDSFKNDARYISIAYQIRIFSQLRFGLIAAVYNTKSTNKGESFFAPVPILSYRVWRITLNTVYLPKHEPVNPFYIFGAYLTVDLVQNDK